MSTPEKAWSAVLDTVSSRVHRALLRAVLW